MTKKEKNEVEKHKDYRSFIFSGSIFLIVVAIVGILTFQPSKKINITEKQITVHAGESIGIDYSVEGLNKDQLTWKSENDEIVSVSASGNILGLKAGTTTVSVSDGKNFKEEIKVTVLVKNGESEFFEEENK